MICYAVIDTNVLVSALLSSKDDAATVQVMEKVITGEIIPVYSNVITKEYREVLSRKKFGFSGNLIEYLMSAVEKYGILASPNKLVKCFVISKAEILPDPGIRPRIPLFSWAFLQIYAIWYGFIV